ncbi:MAG: 16S rRNA (cytosine(1402)-N(4))-methyltransferase RsmH [Dehalococcoidia bacterium]|nr:MAG: 16S rRNA (cytosine(1402)-N(4))-methyltransferase RsmH [Dehalococcoidia bacterium]
MVMSPTVHVPVMLAEVLDALDVRPGGRYVDCTVGGAGHAEAILERSQPGGTLLGIDADAAAIERGTRRLARFDGAFRLVQGNFRDVGDVCRQLEFAPVNGVLMDLGLSSFQLEEGEGFSFQRETPLDMRFGTGGVSAADIINTYSEAELADLIFKLGEDPASRRIARRIVERRPIRTTTELAKAVEQAVGRRANLKTHPATRTFQALRIAVNQELDSLAAALPQAHGLLGFGSRLVVLSYHSLEDRIVKEYIRRESRDCICPPGLPECRCGHRATLRAITRGALKPSLAEVAENPRARSARLRAAERIVERAA